MFDLHTHSICSDGSETPETVAELAFGAGAELFALTDHDCVGGVGAAMRRAAELGLPMLTGVETEAEYPVTLHILGLGMDMEHPGFRALMKKQEACREERNSRLDAKLRAIGMDVAGHLKRSSFSTTRANYAAALVDAGYAESMDDAFGRIIGAGGCAYVRQEHPSPREIITAVTDAGGVTVLAHPMKMHCEPAGLVRELADIGLWGVEAFYSTATLGETQLFSSLAARHGLFTTCGSDFHGARRPDAVIGRCFRECAELERTLHTLKERFRA